MALAEVLSPIPPTLFAMPPVPQSERSEVSEGGLKQAIFELHRAQDFGGVEELARWAERWGEPLTASLQSSTRTALDAARTRFGTISQELEAPTGRLEKLLNTPVGEANWLQVKDDVVAVREAIQDMDEALEKL